MPVAIQNLTNKPVLMRLNSGTSLHLSPGATSSEILETEVSNNEKVKKLEGLHIIALHEMKKAQKKTAAKSKTKDSAKGRK